MNKNKIKGMAIRENISNMNPYDCVVIGGGASGLFFASSFPKSKKHLLILEKNKLPGIKLTITGHGRCNITHAGSIKNFIDKYGKSSHKIRKCLYKHNNIELLSFLHKNGMETISDEKGRIFPVTLNAKDVRDLLLNKSILNGFSILTDSEVTDLSKENGLWNISFKGKSNSYNSVYAKNVVIATGGCSYPGTGSDGKMLHILSEKAGLEITDLSPALSSIYIYNYPFSELSGISFENVLISIYTDIENRTPARKNLLASTSGDILLTHNNFSGPAILNISEYAKKGYKLSVNFIYPLNNEKAFSLLMDKLNSSGLSIANATADIFALPKKFCRKLISENSICRNTASIRRLSELLTFSVFDIKGTDGFKNAMVTHGGVSLDEIDIKTMESKKHPSLFIIGEALDVNGESGGYNLQFAYSSAKTAADEIYSR